MHDNDTMDNIFILSSNNVLFFSFNHKQDGITMSSPLDFGIFDGGSADKNLKIAWILWGDGGYTGILTNNNHIYVYIYIYNIYIIAVYIYIRVYIY